MNLIRRFMSALRSYQQPHFDSLLRVLQAQGAALDASDTGTGKTYVACCLAAALGVVPLVVGPKSTLTAWQRVAASTGIEAETVNYELIRGVRRDVGTDEFAGKLASSEWGCESFSGSGSRWDWHQPYEMVIFDEVHRCGGMKSLNSKLLLAAKRQAKYVLCLSATAASDPRQLYALGSTLDLFEKPKFKWWMLRHGVEPGRFGGFVLTDDLMDQQAAMAKINTDLFPAHGSRMRKEEIPGFPKTQIDLRLIEDDTAKAAALTVDLKNAYREKRGLAALMKIRQQLELLKVPFLVDMAQDAARSSKVVVFVNFKATIGALRPRLEKLLGASVPVIDGENTQAQRDQIVDQFQNDELPALICNNQAGGVGISLHSPVNKMERTSLICPCYNPKDLKQVFGRVQRDEGGFSRQLLVYFAGTQEEHTANRVMQKIDNIDALNDAELNGVIG